MFFQQNLLHRTGANLNSIGAGWREDGEELDLTRRIVECLLERFKRLIKCNHGFFSESDPSMRIGVDVVKKKHSFRAASPG